MNDFVFQLEGVIVVVVPLSKIVNILPENEAEKPLLSDFEVQGQFEIVELFVLEDVHSGSAVSVRFLEIFPTSHWVRLSNCLFVRENVFLREFPLRRPVFNTCSVQRIIRTLVIKLVLFVMRFPSLQEK